MSETTSNTAPKRVLLEIDDRPHLSMTIERFTHSTDPRYTGMRGTVVSCDTGFTTGRAFSTRFPDVFVTDNGAVEIESLCIPAATAAAWLRAVLEHIDARMDAS